MAAKILGSEIPSPDIRRIDIWIEQLSSVYHQLQHLALDVEATSDQVGLAMDARAILADALADAIWLRPSDLSLLVMLRQLHNDYQEVNVRFALAKALATCEPCPEWIGELVVNDPAELEALILELKGNRIEELRKLYDNFRESEVFHQLLRVDPTSSR